MSRPSGILEDRPVPDVAAGLAHLRRAHAGVLEQDAPELLALALRETIDEIGAMVGAVYTEDLLDRIFSRFCIGK